MGALATKALRPLKSFNIENRAHRVISKEKPTPAPRFPGNIEDLNRAKKADPYLDEKLDTKDIAFDTRLKDVYVTSHGKPEDDVTRQIKEQNTHRALPQHRGLVEDFDFGFKEPDKISYGRTTLRHALNFISAHQINPDEVTVAKIALEYKLKEEDVENILKYFKTFEVYLPQTEKTDAQFVGPVSVRKHLYDLDLKKIEGKDKKKEDDDSNFLKIKLEDTRR